MTNDTYNRVNPSEGLIDWGTGVERMYSDAKVDHKHFDTQINWKNLKKQQLLLINNIVWFSENKT